jgi:hypothetical protein
MLLHPVEAEHGVRLVDRDQEIGGIEPRLGHRRLQPVVADPTLLGMISEGPAVDSQPRLVVGTAC